MSHIACNYVKNLMEAPNKCSCGNKLHGSVRITIQEKAVLWYLADCHNDKLNCAWPAIPTIAKYCGVKSRRVQQIIGALVCRGVIERHQRVRKNDSKQSNAYTFPAIDGNGPPLSSEISTGKSNRNLFRSKSDRISEAQRTSPVTGQDCTKIRNSLHGGLASVCTSSGTELHHLNLQGSSTEPLGEVITNPPERTLPPTPLVEGTASTYKTVSDEMIEREVENICVWDQVRMKLETELTSSSISTELPYEYDKFFRDTCQVAAQPGVVIIGAKFPESTELGIRKYRGRITLIFQHLFRYMPELRVQAWHVEER